MLGMRYFTQKRRWKKRIKVNARYIQRNKTVSGMKKGGNRK